MFCTLTLLATKCLMSLVLFFLHGASTRNKNGTTDKLKATQSCYCFSILSPKTSTSFFVWRIIFQTTMRSRCLHSPGKCQMGSSQQQKNIMMGIFSFDLVSILLDTDKKPPPSPNNQQNHLIVFLLSILLLLLLDWDKIRRNSCCSLLLLMLKVILRRGRWMLIWVTFPS